MSSVYFKVAVSDATTEIFNQSLNSSPYTSNTSNDGYILLEYSIFQVPVQLLVLGLTPMTQEEAIAELLLSPWL